MTKSPSLMVILDAELCRTPALLRAAALARQSGDRLLLALFEFDHLLARAARRGFDLNAYLEGRRLKLEEFAAPLRSDGLAVDTRLFWGRPKVLHMLFAVLAEKPELVFKDAHPEAVLPRLLYTPQDLDLMRQCPEPLMLVRLSDREFPRRILAAVDPLDESYHPEKLNEFVMRMAMRLATQCNAQLDVVHVFGYLPFLPEPEALVHWRPDAKIMSELRTLHYEALQKLGRQFGIATERLHLLDGRPDVVITKFVAARKIDLVVMGTVQRNFLQRLAMGSVAERLLQRLDCDVLALKPDGFAEQLQAELEDAKASYQ
ncbi:MAG: universal stress protein [Gammaproteobacteria bacterium]|nr:universal stress protein [Gammaproteobacteria bacterium]MDE2108025.1 universal stress protein [Gammaproteobacteria bacterium]